MRYTLSNANIDAVSDSIEGFMAQNKTEPKNLLTIKLAAEAILLKYQAFFGEDKEFSVKCVRRLHSMRIDFMLPGERCDPFETDEELNSEVLRSILSNMGVIPTWQYKNGANLIVFTPKRKKRSQIIDIAVAVLLAIVCSGIMYLLPENTASFVRDGLAVPVSNTFVGLLSAVGGVLIFLSVAWGIYSMGDTATLGKIGKRMILRFLLMTLLLTMAACAIFLPFFQMTTSGGGSFAFSEIFEMILDIVPSNLIAPFVEGNPLQIIFIAMMVGIAILLLGEKTPVIAAGVEQMNYIIQLIMGGVTSLMPFFVFCSIFIMILNGSVSDILEAYKLFPLLIAGELFIMVIYVCIICVRKRVRSKTLLKKLLPTFLIGLTTASSAAAFSTNMEVCEKQLGIDRKIVQFAIPVGQTAFMPGMSLTFLLGALCMAEIYGVAISPSWLIMAIVTSVILAVASPPVPGGAVTSYTILFTQLGLPAEAVVIMVTLNVILDFISTSTNLFCLQAELVELSGSVDMLDTARLWSEKA